MILAVCLTVAALSWMVAFGICGRTGWMIWMGCLVVFLGFVVRVKAHDAARAYERYVQRLGMEKEADQ